MGAFPALALSWMTQVPTSFGAGWLMSQGKPTAMILIFLLSLAISLDLGNRAGISSNSMFYGLGAGLATFLTVASYTPWMVALKKDKKSGGAKALPLAGLLFAVVTLLGSVAFAQFGDKKWSASLQGALITLMYVFIAGSMGYNGAQAKTNPSAKGQTIYMLALLILLTLFDVTGSLRDDTKASNGNGNGNGNGKPSNVIGNQPEAPQAANVLPTASEAPAAEAAAAEKQKRWQNYLINPFKR